MNQIVQKLCSGTWSRAYRQMGAHPGRSGGRTDGASACGRRTRRMSPSRGFQRLAAAADGAKGRPVGVLRAGGEGSLTATKYVVTGADGHTRWKAIPTRHYSQTRPETASKLFDLSRFRWQTKRRKLPRGPMNIYEVHLGSWRRGRTGGSCRTGELAEQLPGYVRDMGYTCVELLPVTEYRSTTRGATSVRATSRRHRATERPTT